MPTWRLWGRLSTIGPASLSDPVQFRRGRVFWVDSLNGDDSNTGLLKERPKLTFQDTMGNVEAGDTIVLMDGFTMRELDDGSIVSYDLTNLTGLQVIGEGIGQGQAVVDNVNFNNCDRVFFENIRFSAARSSPGGARFLLGDGQILRFSSCILETGEFETSDPVIKLSSGIETDDPSCFLDDCLFRVTARGEPQAILVEQGDLIMTDCTFDGGVYGWPDDGDGNQVCVDMQFGHIWARGLVLRNHSDVRVANLIGEQADIHFTKPEDLGEDCSVLTTESEIS